MLLVVGMLVGLAYWHPGFASSVKPVAVTLTPNTPITLRLDQSIGSKTSKPGQRFGGKLVQPIMVNGKTVLPAGTEFSGTVARAVPAGKLAGGATLRVVLNSFTFQGKEYKVEAEPIVRITEGRGKRTAELAGGGAAIGVLVGVLAHGREGAAIGAVAGAGAGAVGAAATNKTLDVFMPAESQLTFHLGEPVTLAITPPPPAHLAWIFS